MNDPRTQLFGDFYSHLLHPQDLHTLHPPSKNSPSPHSGHAGTFGLSIINDIETSESALIGRFIE